MKLWIRLGITALIALMFFISNQYSANIFSDVLGIFAVIALFQVVVMSFLLETNYKRIHLMIEQGVITDDFNRRQFFNAAIRGFLVSVGIYAFYWLPVLLVIPWMRGVSYVIATLLTLWFVNTYMVKWHRVADVRKKAQLMMLEN